MKSFVGLAGTLMLLIARPPVASASPAVRTPPNIVFIISDDHAFGDYGFMGNRRVYTPHIDRLASQSARFVNGYVPSSVCRPSLATLLTGRYPHEHGIHFNHPPPGFRALGELPTAAQYHAAREVAVKLFRQTTTLPAILNEAGYASYQAGKHWEGTYQQGGFSEGMTVNRPCFEQPWNRQLADGQWVAHGNGDQGLIIGRKTMRPVFDFIDRQADRPFLLWYAPVLPHEPHDAADKYRQLLAGRNVPDYMLGYYANIAWFDDTVGQLLDYLQRRSQIRNTLIVLLADNGWCNAPHSTRQNRRSKRSPFEDGIRTPILLSWPGKIRPATLEGLVSSVDLMPTVLSAAGIDPRKYSLPGIDLLPSACGRQTLDADRPVMGEIYPGDASSLGNPHRDIAYRWIRRKNWKLIVPHNHGSHAPWGNYVGQTSLFDLGSDGSETRNLVHDPHYAAEVAQLMALLDQWWPVDKR